MNGKNKCRILKDIRREIAKQNDIDLAVEECKFKGDCLGTCPKCESEVRYLEKELEKRRTLGKRVAVAGIVTSLALTSAGCSLLDKVIDTSTKGQLPTEESAVTEKTPLTTMTLGEVDLQGDIAYVPESETEEETAPESETEKKETKQPVILGMLVAPDEY